MTAAAVLFDLDGVLINSEPLWFAVESAYVEQIGGRWSRAHQARCIGGTLDAACRYIAEVTGSDIPVWEMRAHIMAAMTEGFARADLEVLPGAVELVDAVRSRGVRTGLVTSSYRPLADAALARLGAHRFDVTVAGDEVTNGKPDPEPYRTACDRLDVAAADVVVIEDAVNGVTSAEAAGCTVVAVPSVTPIEKLATRPVVQRIVDIDPDWLIRLPASLRRDSA